LRISVITPRLRNASLSFISLRESLNLLNRRSIARTSFAILVTRLRTILIRAEIVIAKYTLIDPAPAEAVAAIVVPSVLVISERIRGAAVERVPLRPCVLL
jgi:hypothetical protein